MQPASSRSERLPIEPPNRRIELPNVFRPGDRELHRAPCTFVPILDMRRVTSVDPFCYPIPLYAFDAEQGVAVKAHPPGGRTPDVGSQSRSLNTDDGIRKIWQRHAAQSRPKQGCRRD